MNLISEISFDDHDRLDKLAAAELASMSEADLEVELERRRAWVVWVQERIEAIEIELPQLHAERARWDDDIRALEPEVSRAVAKTLLPNQIGVVPDAAWRAEFPQASKLVNTREGLTKPRDGLALFVSRRETELKHLKNHSLGYKAGLVRDAEQALERRRAGNAAAVAETQQRTERPSLFDLAARLVGKA